MNKKISTIITVAMFTIAINLSSAFAITTGQESGISEAATTGGITTGVKTTENNGVYGKYFEAVMKFAKEKFKDDVSQEKLLENALKGMFSGLDKYSEFFSKKDAESFLADIEGNYTGIGVYISKADDGSLVVEKVFRDSPAMSAGLLDGDRIFEVNGESILEKSADEAARIIKGPVETSVKVKALRGQKEKEFSILRRDVQVNPVEYRIAKDVAVIKLDLFNLHANQEVQKVVNDIDSKGIKKVLLDLRGNPGGELNEVVKIAKNFVPEGLITKLEMKPEEEEDKSYYSDLKKLKYELAVLVNGSSASASEVLAGAIQDTKAGTLIGTKTFGKSRVQKLYPLVDTQVFQDAGQDLSSGIVNAQQLRLQLGKNIDEKNFFGWAKVTVGEYLTPKGRKIDGNGIIPDVVIDKETLAEKENGLEGLKILARVSPLNKTKKFKQGDEDSSVMQVERILKVAGYEVGEPDAQYDEKTFFAIGKFQSDSGLFPYGVTDFATQDKLNGLYEQLLIQKDPYYAKGMEVLKVR